MFSLLFVFVFVIGGCEGNINDLQSQIKYIDRIIENNDLFDDDYQIEGSLAYDNEILTYTYIVDEKNYYLEFKNDEINKYYFIEQENRYLLIKNNFYKYIDKVETEDMIMDIFNSLEIEFIFYLKDLYTNVKNNLEIFIDKCINDNNYKCEAEKSFPSKLEFLSHVDVNEDIESEITYLFKKGKILKTTSLFKKGNYVVRKENSYDYSSQSIEISSLNKYKFNENL